ncbi:universal stress protein [Natrinema sp. 1APR25-10V2]|uniref:universal stress protein n=1 Tax=Natrinema sp. 1APR25-10V2 TaxID=2951081 RepID=UPI002874F3D9|nr:universal stress protein [Natrinema sp. 1APR25-10V2]MDS0473636.1 universal stress protein [Natrinema sp. 1APR25-10V2]
MLSRVLVPMDGSTLSERALEYALENHPDASVTVLSVVGEPSVMMGEAMSIAFEDDIEVAAEERAAPVFERAREISAEYDAEIDTAVTVGRPARAIITRAEDYETVVIGSHSSDMIDRLFVGNVAETVFKRSPVPVTVVR